MYWEDDKYGTWGGHPDSLAWVRMAKTKNFYYMEENYFGFLGQYTRYQVIDILIESNRMYAHDRQVHACIDAYDEYMRDHPLVPKQDAIILVARELTKDNPDMGLLMYYYPEEFYNMDGDDVEAIAARLRNYLDLEYPQLDDYITGIGCICRCPPRPVVRASYYAHIIQYKGGLSVPVSDALLAGLCLLVARMDYACGETSMREGDLWPQNAVDKTGICLADLQAHLANFLEVVDSPPKSLEIERKFGHDIHFSVADWKRADRDWLKKIVKLETGLRNMCINSILDNLVGGAEDLPLPRVMCKEIREKAHKGPYSKVIIRKTKKLRVVPFTEGFWWKKCV